MQEEVWKDIEEYYMSYQVSNYGNVRALDRVVFTTSGKEMKMKAKNISISIGSHGYGYVSLRCGFTGKRKNKLVHRLVAAAFISNDDILPEVNHIDEVKTNNHSSNLEWCTRQYNSEYSLSKHYKFIDPSGNLVEIFNLHKFSRENNLSGSLMSEVHSNQRKSHKGWTKA